MLERGEIECTSLRHIVVGERRRNPTERQIADMAKSLEENGLLTPVLVRIVYDDPTVEQADSPNHIELVCGATRLAAAKKLGWREIDAQFVDGDEIDFRLAEIVENLHRGELTKLERDEHIAEYVRLSEERQSAQVGPKGRGHRPQGGVNAAARDLGLSRGSAQRAVKVASIAEPAKEAAREAGIDDNQSALLAIASETTTEAQIAKAKQIAEHKRERPRSPVRLPDEPLNEFEATQKQVAALMAAWNKAGTEAREQFLARIDRPVFDNTRSGAAA